MVLHLYTLSGIINSKYEQHLLRKVYITFNTALYILCWWLTISECGVQIMYQPQVIYQPPPDAQVIYQPDALDITPTSIAVFMSVPINNTL